MRIGIIAGEASGDILGAGLLSALRLSYPHLEAVGIAGPLMQAQGCQSLYPMERLSVMGFVEPLKHLPSLFMMRRKLIQQFIKRRIDVFIGIDAPAFNTGLEYHLKKAGIPVVHYVSPSVWAWRQKRIHKIKQSVDLMLTLFPFENVIYEKEKIPVCFVGHPLADTIPLQTDRDAARLALGLPKDARILALLPGSREMEVRRLTQDFLEAARLCHQRWPDLQVVAPMTNDILQQRFKEAAAHLAPDLPITVLRGQSHLAMAAADVILLASGTATLEALLLGKPMVVAYKLSPLTYALAKRWVKVPYVALPNLLANTALVPEVLQDEVEPDRLAKLILHYFENPAELLQLRNAFLRIHETLRQNANQKAAAAVLQLLGKS